MKYKQIGLLCFVIASGLINTTSKKEKGTIFTNTAYYLTCGNTCRKIFTNSFGSFTTSGVLQAYISDGLGSWIPLFADQWCTDPISFNGC